MSDNPFDFELSPAPELLGLGPDIFDFRDFVPTAEGQPDGSWGLTYGDVAGLADQARRASDSDAFSTGLSAAAQVLRRLGTDAGEQDLVEQAEADRAFGGADRFLVVTGVAGDADTKELVGFFVNDPATGERGRFVSVEAMRQGWQTATGADGLSSCVVVIPRDPG